LARPLQKSLLAAALVLGAGWGSPVQPGQTDDGPATASVITSPSLALSARRGVVTLVGHTVSRRHEARLQQALARHFPDRDHAVEFRPFGPAPDWWAEATVELVGAIAAARAPRVKLDDRGLIVRALARQSAAARDSVVSIARSLPVALETDVRILDAGPDGGADSGIDAGVDSGVDAGPEGGPEPRPDGSVDDVVRREAGCECSASGRANRRVWLTALLLSR
jgi:hypothetical protein